MINKALSALLTIVVAVAPAAAQAGGASLIGNAAAVRGAVKAASVGAVGRVISSGKPLFLNDHVTTDAGGRLQILLLDETVFTLGPNSDMVLDTFVYDPASNAGKVNATIAKGTFRFVTGKVARKDPSKMKVKLAVGTIGVRGSIGVGETGPNGSTIINGGARNADDGEDRAGIYAEHNGKVVNLGQPGVGVRIGPDGKMGGPGFVVGDLDRIMNTLKNEGGPNTGGKGGHAGGDGRLTDTSGRGTAVGAILAGDSQDLASLTGELGSTLSNTVQGINSGAISTWDAVRTLTTGTGVYAGVGTYACSGGSQCNFSAGATGTFDFNATLNFGTQQIQSGSLVLAGPLTYTATLIAQSYSGFTGQAKEVLVNGTNVSSTGSSNFSNTVITLQDRNGVIAKDVLIDLKFSDSSSNTGTGTGSGSR